MRPSPDRLHASCAFDPGDGPLRIPAEIPEGVGYLLLSLFAANTDRFFVVNDRTDRELALDAARRTFRRAPL